MNAHSNLSRVLFESLFASKQTECFTLLNKDLTVNVSYSASELLRKSLNIAQNIQKNIPEDRVMLVCVSSADFVLLFLAGIFSGKIVIPSQVPKSGLQYAKLLTIANNCGTYRVLCDDKSIALISSNHHDQNNFCFSTTEDLFDSTFQEVNENSWINLKGFQCKEEDIGYIQYSSGSYGDPKGVALSHKHILTNIRAASQAANVNKDSVIGTWLPMYHDMGLAFLLGFLLNGCRLIAISPLAFIQRPASWLQMISNYKISLTGGPPFAYDLCIQRIKEVEKLKLDLSSWQTAYMGSEIVRQEVLDRFSDAFKNYSFDKNAAYSIYGMAEATCFVCGSQATDDHKEYNSFQLKRKIKPVCLYNEDLDNLCIVDSNTGNVVPDGEKGEIYFASPSLGYGYVEKVENNQLILDSSRFENYFEISGNKRWFKTGDIGIKEGLALWVLGRKNDMFKVNGENLLAVDVEILAATVHPNLNAHGAAAFRADDDEDNSANLLIEVYSNFHNDIDLNALIIKLKSKIYSSFGLHLRQILILKRGALERTSSGKIQRNVIAQDYTFNKYLKYTYASSL